MIFYHLKYPNTNVQESEYEPINNYQYQTPILNDGEKKRLNH